MDLQDYKDISRIYNEKTFKKQLFFQGIFLSFIVLSIPILELIMEITPINIQFFGMQRSLVGILWFIVSSLLVIIWIIISSRLEKKEIFIPLNYYRIIRFRVCYILAFYMLAIIFFDSNLTFPMLMYALIYIPIEIYSSHKEYLTFKKKMEELLR